MSLENNVENLFNIMVSTILLNLYYFLSEVATYWSLTIIDIYY